jgi:uncharacterized surface protein with fasciclin (FAS1) repeats
MKHVFIFLFAIALFSCERENLTNEKVKILDGIKKDPELTRLSAAIDRAGLRNALTGTQYTFFAPTDAAFTAAGIDPNAVEPTVLLRILQYHMIPSRVDSSRFGVEFGIFNAQMAGPSWVGQLTFQGFQTLNLGLNANVYCTNATQEVPVGSGNVVGRGVFFNGASVVGFDAFEGADGVVHKINAVLLPPPGNLADVVAADPDLSIFNKLILKASGTGALPNFATGALLPLPADPLATARTGTLTVLAPNNSAMNTAGVTEAFIDGATPAACLDIARRHVVSLRTFSSDFFNNSIRPTPTITYNTLQTGKTVTFNSDANGVFFTNALTTRASVVAANIVATNGVLHKLSATIN